MKIHFEVVQEYEQDIKKGEKVFGYFTAHSQNFRVLGEYIGATKNYHRIRILENFRKRIDGNYFEEVGNVLHIATTDSKNWSENNTIANPVWEY